MDLAGLSLAPGWCLLLGTVGKILLAAGALLFALSTAFSVFGHSSERNSGWRSWTFVAGCATIFGAALVLATLFLEDQFEFVYVASHSIQDLSPAYKVAAVWSGQEGSFLLWAMASALFGLLSMRGTGAYRRWFTATYAAFLATLCGILVYESPFGLVPGVAVGGQIYMPPRGMGLAASLQNYWVVVHPPVIFLGFGALAVPFAYAVSAMLSGDVRSWAPQARPWALVSLSLLGLGLVMGGLWAYETQGWGGFWAWDPVENVSLVPWLLNAAFVHGLIMQVARKRWHWANLLLGAVPFLLFLYGTFLTRSGFLSKFSVHSFAEMNRSALWLLLGLLVVAFASFFCLWLGRGRRLARACDEHTPISLASREAGFHAGAIILSLLAVTVAIGMSIPFFLGLVGRDARVVEEPQYHLVTVWFFMPAMLLMAVAPFLNWRHRPVAGFWLRVVRTVSTAVLIVAACLFVLLRSDWRAHADFASRIAFPFGMSVPRVPWVIILFSFPALAIAGNSWRVAEMVKRTKLGVGGFVAHAGVAIALSGLILSRGLEQKEQVLVAAGVPGAGLGYSVHYVRMTSDPETDRSNKVVFSLSSVGAPGDTAVHVRPGFFFSQGAEGEMDPFTSPAILRGVSHDVYVSLAAPQMNLFDAPERFHVGETKTGVGVSITYLGLTVHGTPGTPSALFGARLKVVEDGRPYSAEPSYSAASGPSVVDASPSLRATLTGINPADNSILLQMPYKKTVYPLELFYKPMTGLIWLGAALMAAGGFMTAAYRRMRG